MNKHINDVHIYYGIWYFKILQQNSEEKISLNYVENYF